MDQISDLKREKEQASDASDQLRLQLDHAKQNIVNADDKLNTITRERDQLKLNWGSASKSYKDLLVLYEEHVSHTDKKISNFEAKIASVIAEKDALESKKNELERRLEEEKELRKVHFKQLTGAIDTSGDTQTSSNLLKLIREYQQVNSHPEDIFQDFFELRAKYNKVLRDNQQATDVADSMTRKLNENENLFNRLHRELTAAKETVDDLTQNLASEKSARDKLEKANKSLTNTVNDLSQDKKSLEASLKDTTYQLQYLLSDVQRRNEPIPMGLQKSAELLTAAEVIPGLAHDQLVYKNIAELQDLNHKLISEVRDLTQKVQATSTEISSANLRRNTDVEQYKTALAEAKQTTTDLSNKSKDLQKQLDTLTIQSNNYKNLIDQLGDGDANSRFEQMKQTQLRQREEMDITFETYREETSKEINKLKEELESTRASATEARNQLANVNVEIAHLRRKHNQLSSTIEQKEEDIKNHKRQTTTYQERVATRDRELMHVKEQLSDFKVKTEVLRNENNSLNIRLESVTSAYNTTKELAHGDSAEKAHMSHILQAINNRMESFATSSSESVQQSKETIEKLSRELQHTRDTLAMAEKELDSYKSLDQQEIQDKYKESVIEVRFLKTKVSEIEQQLSNVNQDRIIAQTKLATAEEQLKKVSAVSTDGSTSPNGAVDSTSCDEHIRLLAEAEDRIRVLEADIEKYHAVIADNDKKADQLTKDHEDFVNKSQITINDLLKQLEIKATEAANAQGEAEKSIAEFKILHEKDVTTQAELTTEKRTLEEKLKELDADNLIKESELKSLRETVEEKTSAFTEVENKLATEVKTTEEQRQTINSLRTDVSKLTSEISEYKGQVNASTTALESLKVNYECEAGERAEFEENLKKSLAESEKQREKLVDRVEELIKKHSEWKTSASNDGNADNSTFEGATQEILQQLREANETLRIERDANETKYRYEHNNLKRVEAELVPVKHQAIHLQAECDRLREDIKKLNDAGKEESGSYRMQCDAFKSQNQSLIKENEVLREKKEHAQAELDKKNTEVTPLNGKTLMFIHSNSG
jgi:chromosome segregation ATPase